MTEATYRKKALPYLLQDFGGRCAYCLDPNDFRRPSDDHIDHFDCKLRGRKRHFYKNLMLACQACNHSKLAKPVVNPLDKKQRLLNCTEENEFPAHILETDDGQWKPLTPAAEYHLTCIGLTERCHNEKRRARREIAERILGLCRQAVEYRTSNPAAVQKEMMDTIALLLDHLEHFPPLVTEHGLKSTREWLEDHDVDITLFARQ